MYIEKKQINFVDKRGSIRDILTGIEIDAITIITSKKGSIRGNHFHKQSIQYSYIIKGRFLCASQVGDEPIAIHEGEVGDLITNPPGEKHAFKALEDSVLLSLTKGPRRGGNYEEDTIHLEKAILS